MRTTDEYAKVHQISPSANGTPIQFQAIDIRPLRALFFTQYTRKWYVNTSIAVD